MIRIRRLPDDIINKIAAGEVVERPASVVKELLENSIDAGARSVRVETAGGGKSRICVRDDGCGMGREDAEAALERHATSKLVAFEDLQRIATHGFRGEALPSIASVADLVLTTCEEGAPAGTELHVRHGELLYVRDAGHPRGTTVTVSDLFGAVPARRKFLRAEATEASHIAESVTLLALARPLVGFVLTSAGRSVIDAPPVDGLEARLYQIFGRRFLEGMVPVEGGIEWAQVRGFTSRPDRASGARPSVRLFVNGRAVRDRALMKAVSEAYRRAGAGSHVPETFLFIEVPPHMVDVNVHPAKTEVKFADPRAVWMAAEGAVGEAISRAARQEPPSVSRDGVVRVQEAVETYHARVEPAERGAPRPPVWDRGGLPVSAEAKQASLAAREHVVLGQHRATYIVATDGDDLILIDQHTAHERVRFEELLDRALQRTAESQRLLLPIVTEVPPALRELLRVHMDGLGLLGYEVEPFGGDMIRLCAVPALLPPADPAATLLGVLRDMAEREGPDWATLGARDRLAATLACHSAVRAGQILRPETMSAIARDLMKTRHPSLCPHGRPTIVRIPQDDVSRWFGRTGWGRR